MKFSIIVPVYNVENYLAECLDSVLLEQETDDFEVILVNDGSTDGSTEICKYYVEKFSQIKYIYQDNQGLSVARNTGIAAAQGEYLIFLDSDDKLRGNVLPALIKATDEQSDIIIAKLTKFWDDSDNIESYPIDFGQYEKYKNPAQLFHKLNQNKLFWLAAVLLIVNRKFLMKNKLFFRAGICHEDELWFPTVMITAQTVTQFNDFFYLYRSGRQGSIMYKPNIKKEFDKLIIAELLSESKPKVHSDVYKVLSFRAATLVWGVIYWRNAVKTDDRYEELIRDIKKHLYCLKYRKYWLIYLLVKLNIMRL